MNDTRVIVTTRKCGMCGKTGAVEVTAEGYQAWKNGTLIQDAFPYLDKAIREQMISGTHPMCWQEMVAGMSETAGE